MEGLTYRCSVIADPWAEVYSVTKYDLIRKTSKTILHRLFCDYQAPISDGRLVQRLRQKSRWSNYKRDLLDEIHNRKNRNQAGQIDRAGPTRRTGVGNLTPQDCERIGGDSKLWDKRA